MPRFPPTLRGRWGDGIDYVGNMTTNVEFDVVAGDMVVIVLGTSDYRHRAQGAPYWAVGAGEGFVERGAVYGNQYWANCYTWTARATWTGHAKVEVPVSGGNDGANSSAIRAHVWSGSDGVGAQAAVRGEGAPQIGITTVRDYSAISYVGVDWNAANGTPAMLGGSVQDHFINGGYAEFLYVYAPDTGLAGYKAIGAHQPTNWKTSMACVEILGQFRDTTQPGAVSSISATVLGSTEVRIDWGAATDDVGVTRYRVFDYSTQIADVDANTRSFVHSGLAGSSTHQYTVRAVDAAGNVGGVLESKTVTTAAAIPPANRAFLGPNKPTLRLGTNLVKNLYVGSTRIWP